MSSRIKSFKGLLYGFLIASLLWVVPYFYFKEEPGPIPYTVSSVKYAIKDNVLTIVGNYEQKSCEFVTDGLFGSYLGNVAALGFKPIPAATTEQLAGNHTVTIVTDELLKRYEWIEYRTRHRCLVYTDQFGNISLKPNTASTPTTMLVDKIFVRIPTIGKFTGNLDLIEDDNGSGVIQSGPDILNQADRLIPEELIETPSAAPISGDVQPFENFSPIE